MAPVFPGYYDSSGHPCLKVHLLGVKHTPPGVEHEVMIDTGFSGFLQIPIVHAIALQLPLQGTQTFTLANGEKNNALTALVDATLGQTTVTSVAVLSGSNIFLAGMSFLREFDHALFISKNRVGMLNETWLESQDPTPAQ